MKLDLNDRVLRSVPLQAILHEGIVILKRGALETRLEGAGIAEIVQLVLDATSGAGIAREQLVARFAEPGRADVEALLELMLDRRLLVVANAAESTPDPAETALDVFYWNLGQSAAEVNKSLAERRITVLGVNHITHAIVSILQSSGLHPPTVVDYPLFRNISFFDESGALNPARWPHPSPRAFEPWAESLERGSIDCLVATSDFGGLHWMRQWNEVCVTNNIHFLPVVLQNVIGYVGPLVVPGDTACFECARARQNAHMADHDLRRASELVAFEGQSIAAYHPAMPMAVASVAAMELTKLYGNLRVPRRRVGVLLEVNLLAPTITAHKVLKVPRCTVCGINSIHPAVTPSKTTFLPGNRVAQ